MQGWTLPCCSHESVVGVHNWSRPTVARRPIQIDNVRFPLGHRIGRRGKTDPLPWSVEAPELKARLDLAVRAGRVYVNGGSENQNGNSGLTGNEGDGSSSGAHNRCPIRTNHRTGHPLTTDLLAILKLSLLFRRSASESKS